MPANYEVNPVIQRLNELMKAKKLKLTQVQDILLTHYLTTDKKKQNHYQRLYKLTTGEFNELTPEEEKAIKRLIDVESDPHRYGSQIEKAGNIKGKLRELEKAINSGFYNPVHIKRAFKDLNHVGALQ
jgi:hypothetical protein